MIGAMIIEHAQFGFFMNWFGNQKGEGIEFDLLVFGMSLALIFLGSGAISFDQFIANRISAKK
jgi:putative oxidoreductase